MARVWSTNVKASFVKCFGMRAANERWCMGWFIAGDRVNVLSGTRLRVSGELQPDAERRINEVCWVMWAFKAALQCSVAATAKKERKKERETLIVMHPFFPARLHGYFRSCGEEPSATQVVHTASESVGGEQLAAGIIFPHPLIHSSRCTCLMGAVCVNCSTGGGGRLVYVRFTTQENTTRKNKLLNVNSWVWVRAVWSQRVQSQGRSVVGTAKDRKLLLIQYSYTTNKHIELSPFKLKVCTLM